jgi:transcriptional regulator with XRE-family HTH domain
MGKTAREGPKKLGKKLKQIRERFGLSQNEMLVRLGLDKRLTRTAISGFELGTSEPSLLVLRRYARLAGVSTDAITHRQV